jgi:hypothetical protein
MQPIKDAQMREYLLSPDRPDVAREAKALPEGELAAILRMANGAIGRALTLLEKEKRAPVLARRTAAEQFCHTLAQMRAPDELLALLLSFGTAREDLLARLSAITEALRDLLLLNYTDNAPMIFFTDREAASELSACFAAERLHSFLKATEETMEQLSANANARLTLFRYFDLLIKK